MPPPPADSTPAPASADNAPAHSTSAPADPVGGLPALEARLRQDMSWLELPARPWLPPRHHAGEDVLDVAILGGGMAGMAASAALGFIGIRAPIFDQSPAGFEGPWATTAKMETLRSPKQLTGPALGLPALTYRAWFEAQFGSAAWDGLDKIARLSWMDYLRWYRRVLNLEVHNNHRVLSVTPRDDGLVALDIRNPERRWTCLTRRLVLATGRDGLGGVSVPPWVARLPRDRWAHSSDTLDDAQLSGRRIGVVGAGAAAMDSAATALEAGAARVDLLIRRADLPRINKGKGAGNAGFTNGYVNLPDLWRWRIRHYVNRQQTPPPRGSTLRVSRHANAAFHFDNAITDAHVENDHIVVSTAHRRFEFDLLILATGFSIDWSARPELASLAPHVRAWQDRFDAPPDLPDAELARSPDLGPAFEFQQKVPGECPGLERIHCFCYPATMSHGTVSGDIPAISEGAGRLARGIASLFYQEDIDHHFANLLNYAEPELLGDEWTPTPPPTAHRE